MNLEQLITLEQKPKESLIIKLVTLTVLLDKLANTYNNYYLPSIVAEVTIIRYFEEKFKKELLETTTARRNPRTGNLKKIGTPIIVEAIEIILQTAFGQYTKTRIYYIRKIVSLLEDYKLEIAKEIPTLKTPRLKEYFRIVVISISINQEILEERIKEILT
ncbi:hypothetical protein C2G38_2169421 [Gigaspora rosea]|uniref:Uncharacterized protein n=1 Tax=Gigaspora rosea TaxID=44941 RepID=A0A397VQ88_9GLOM|nr:hypothetical protein C2G38_2169421 [Gigaspora rosea]